MATGDKKGALTGNANSIPNPAVLSGSVAVVIGDLVFGVIGQQTNLTATTTISDNLGNSYSFQNAGTDPGSPTARPFYGRITVAGTLTTINVPTSSSTNDWAGRAVVIEGPFIVSPLDGNPGNITSDATSPFTCPSTGTLGQALEVVIGWGCANQSTVWAATSPNLLDGNTNNSTNVKVAIGYQLVTSTSAVQPEFTAAANPTTCILGTASFKVKMTGTAAQTLAVSTQVATGTERMAATAAQTLAQATQAATGIMFPEGTAAQTLAPATQAATGAERIAGTAASVLAPCSQAASAAERFAGTAVQLLAPSTQEATGDVGDPPVTGTIVQTLAPASQSATAAERIAGSAAQTLAPASQAAVSFERLVAVIVQTLVAASQAASGTERISGSIAQVAARAVQSATGTGGAGGPVGDGDDDLQRPIQLLGIGRSVHQQAGLLIWKSKRSSVR